MTRLRDIADVTRAAPIIPVITIERVEDAAPLAGALLAGGLRAIEITLRSDAALAAAERVRQEVPDMILGIGTVMRPQQLEEAARLGADFAVSPGATPELLAAAREIPMPFLPGAATASEIMGLAATGWRHVKFFPAEAAGGLDALRAFASVFPELRFCPTGGINENNAAAYLALRNVSSVGGSWIAPPSLLAGQDWNQIRVRAEQATALSRRAP